MTDVNLNVNPYYDDYDDSKNFQKVLFKPSVAVQARELTQLQTILEQQIKRHGDHIFREGSIVEGMESSLDLDAGFVKVKDTDPENNIINLNDFLGKTVRGLTSGVEGIVSNVADGTEGTLITATTGPKTLYVKYNKTGTNNIQRIFSSGETIVDVADINKKCIAFSEEPSYGSRIIVDEGIIYAKGRFLKVSKQSAILDRYSDSPSLKVGYTVVGNFIDTGDDTTLFDPAQGAPNFGAPGADRLKFTLSLTAKELDSTDLDDFVELFEVEEGKISRSSQVPQYADLRKEFARRTFDESGNYTVRPFNIRIREHLNDGTNAGRYTKANGGDFNQVVVGVEPGTAYVRGYKYENIITEYLNIIKAIDTEEIENQKISASYGNYVICDEVVGSFGVDSLVEVSLRDTPADSITNTTFGATASPGNEIGKARIRSIVHESGNPGSADCKYRLYLFDIRMTSNKEFPNVKCITNLPASSVKFLADTILTEKQGVNSNILFENGEDQFLTEDGKFKSVFEDSVDAERTSLKETGKFNKLVYRLPQTNIKRIRDSNGEVETTFKFKREFDITFSSVGVATLSTGLSDEVFPFSPGGLSESNRRENFYIVPTETKGNLKIGQPINFSVAGTNGARSITILTTNSVSFNVNETLSGGMTAKVICSLSKTNARESKKLLTKNKQVVIDSTHPKGTTGPWSLGVSDCYKLVSVHMSSNSGSLPTSNDQNVTENFELDSGMRDNFYDYGLLKKKTSSTLNITGQLLVTFDYFKHDSTQGVGYFSVDSYPVDDSGETANTIKTWQIPFYNSTIEGEKFDLRDCIDCRPRRLDSNVTTNPPEGSVANFEIASGGIHNMVPNSDIESDLEFYLPRKDKIVINKEGNFNTIKGVPRFPSAFVPQDNDESMTIALLDIPAYPSLPSQLAKEFNRPGIKLNLVSNQRYTMKDIGQLEQRINRVEYYTALSLLEKDTTDLQIPDGDGIDRFKNGILVDPFTGHNIGDVTNPDYKASIDTQKQELRPKFTLNNIPFTINSTTSTNVSRRSKSVILTISSVSGTFVDFETIVGESSSATAKIANLAISANRLYCDDLTGTFTTEKITGVTSKATATITLIELPKEGNLVTLPYTHESYTSNAFASKERNCVSELLFTWSGEIELSPNTDNWVDTNQRPDVQVNFDNNNDAWEVLEDAWETHWNDWETVFTGTEEISRERIGGRLRLEGARGQNVFQEENERITTLISQHQTRTGVQLDVTPEAVTHRLGSKLVDVSIVPFIRERVVEFKATRMKPNTKVYAFFDGEDVNAFTAPSGGNWGDTLLTDVKGEISGRFRIPNTETIRFRVGDRKFRLADAYDGETKGISTEYSRNVTTSAESTYTARGLLQTKEETIISTEVANVQRIEVTDSRVQEELRTTVNNTGERFVGEVANQQIVNITNVTNNTTNVQAGDPCDAFPPGSADRHHCRQRVHGHDPIAQTFIVLEQGGIFASKLDLFFATKSQSLPITCQIREVVNGFPGQRIIPNGSVTLQPSDINISNDATIATPVYFNSPVYLSHNTEYCFVLLPAGNNPDYNIWVSELGQNLIGTTTRVSEQPHVGILFTSANNRTWTARQAEDIKFTLYRAKFEADKTGQAIFENKKVDYCNINDLTGDGNFQVGETITGGTSNATGVVETYAKNKLKLQIFNTSGTFQANETITGGTSGVTAKLVSFEDFSVNVIHPQVEQLILHATSASWNIKTTNNSNTIDSSNITVTIGENNTLLSEKRVLSYVNEIGNLDSKRSLSLNSTLTSGFDTISPIIDLRRLSAILVSNNINNDSTNETNASGGNAEAKYISKRIVLSEGLDAEDIKVFITATRPSSSDIEVYYRILNSSDETDFDNRPFTKMDLVTDSNLFSSDMPDLDDFKEFEYSVPVSQLSGPNGEIQYQGIQSGNPVFTGFKIMAFKIVMKSVTKSLVPRIKDLRAIALSV